MLAFIEEYAHQWKAGQLSERAQRREHAPWQQRNKTKQSACELSQTTYKDYQDTISFLVESYLKDKKKFVKFHQVDGLNSPLSPRM